MQVQPITSSRSEQLARSLIVSLICAAPALICLHSAAGCVSDPDIWWHLRTGEWIAQHHAFPHTDPFSRAVGGSPWQAYSWLFELILLKLYSWFNLKGIVLYSVVLMGLIAAAVCRMVSRLQRDFSLSALLSMAVAISLCRLGTPRPWLVTILFFTLEMDILMHSRQNGESRELLWLVPLFAVWANVHIQFIDGLLVLGIAACEPLAARWWKSESHPAKASRLWLTLGACVAATCLNPYGVRIYKTAWELGSQPGVLNSVSEMMALSFRSGLDFLFLFLVLAATGVLFRYRGLPPFETVMLIVAAVLSFRSRRDIWVMLITAGAILAAGLPSRAGRGERKALSSWAWPVSAALTALMVAAGAMYLHIDNPRLRSLVAEKLPLQAVEVVQERHYGGSVFNNYDWGGFLIWQLREPVAIDGRAALYGDARMDRSRKTWAGAPQWASDPDLQSAGVVIAPDAAALTQLLRTDPRFQLSYEDKIAAVFVAKQSQGNGHGDLAALHQSEMVPERQLP